MNRHAPLLLCSVALLGLCLPIGCQSVESPLAKPLGTAAAKPKKQLQKFDPFPDTRIGPRIAGLRPPGFRKPVSEPARSRQQDNGSGKNSPQEVTPPAR